MRVIFVTREGRRLAGARIRCYRFAQELERRGIQAQVLSFADSLGARDGMRERQMTLRDKLAVNMAALRILAKERGSIFYLHRFNYHSLAPCLASLINRNRIILDLDDWEIREDPPSKAYDATRYLAKKSLFCVAASRYLESFLRPLNKRVSFIPSGVDTSVFVPPAGPGGPDVTEGVRFCWIGTFDHPAHVENIRFALEAFGQLVSRCPAATLEICGGGLYEKEVAGLARPYEGRGVVLKGWIPFEEIPSYLAGVDAGLMPVARATKYNMAKSPTKLFEYMATARPVVASAIGEAKEIISPEVSGLLAQDVASFAGQMERLVRDPGLRRRLGAGARKTVCDSYAIDALGGRLFDVLKENFR